MNQNETQKIVIGLIVAVCAAIIAGVFLATWGPSQPVTVTNTPTVVAPTPNTIINNDSIAEYNKAYTSTVKVANLLEKIKSGKVSQKDQDMVASEVRINLAIIESYYRKTNNCEIGLILKEFLNYIISINENNIGNSSDDKFNKFKELVHDIEKKCKN